MRARKGAIRPSGLDIAQTEPPKVIEIHIRPNPLIDHVLNCSSDVRAYTGKSQQPSDLDNKLLLGERKTLADRLERRSLELRRRN